MSKIHLYIYKGISSSFIFLKNLFLFVLSIFSFILMFSSTILLILLVLAAPFFCGLSEHHEILPKFFGVIVLGVCLSMLIFQGSDEMKRSIERFFEENKWYKKIILYHHYLFYKLSGKRTNTNGCFVFNDVTCPYTCQLCEKKEEFRVWRDCLNRTEDCPKHCNGCQTLSFPPVKNPEWACRNTCQHGWFCVEYGEYGHEDNCETCWKFVKKTTDLQGNSI